MKFYLNIFECLSNTDFMANEAVLLQFIFCLMEPVNQSLDRFLKLLPLVVDRLQGFQPIRDMLAHFLPTVVKDAQTF